MAGDRYTIVSADGHVGADLLDYRQYLPSSWYADFDAWAAAYENPFADLERPDASRNWDSARREAELAADGVVAEVLFPNTVPPFFPSNMLSARPPENAAELERRTAGLRAHNRWLAEFCAELPGRRAGLAQVFVNDPDRAVEDIAWAADHGLRGVLVPAIPPDAGIPGLYSSVYDPVWAACQDHDLTVCQHGGSGVPDFAGPGANVFLYLMEVPYFANRTLWHMIVGGIFERFPRLRFTMTEQKVGWVPDVLARMDTFWKQWNTTGQVGLVHAEADQLPHEPSFYFHRNCWMGSSFTPRREAEIIIELGPERVMWGADFPHDEGTHPHTREALRHSFHDWDQEMLRDLLGRTAAEVYGLDYDELDALDIGPGVEETAMLLEEIPESHSLAFTYR